MSQASAVWASRAWAASTFFFACAYYTHGWSLYAGWLFYPLGLLFVVPIIVGVRHVVVGHGSGDVASMAFETMALGLLATPVLGGMFYLLAQLWAHSGGVVEDQGCVLRKGWIEGVVLGMWPACIAGDVLVVGCVLRRRAALATLRWRHAVATVVAMLAAPLLAPLVGFGALMELGGLGGVALVLSPALLAAGGTVVTWATGRPFAGALGLRRLAVVAMALGVLVGTALGANVEEGCPTTWSLVSLAGPGWLWLAFAGILLFVRDPQGVAGQGTPQSGAGGEPTLSDPGPEGSSAMGDEHGRGD